MNTNRVVLENAVLKHAAALNPIHTKQVVLALEDREYAELLEYDDQDKLDPASVNRALKRLAAEEPNLFYMPESAKDLDDGSFKGKAPGGGLPGNNTAESDEQNKVTEMLERLGIKH
jgi:hypothetical protein